jgi:hypothetical protein
MAPPIRNVCGRGVSATPVIGASARRSRGVRYKMSALLKWLNNNLLNSQTPKTSFVVRYKMSAGFKHLCWWDLSRK